MLNDYATLLFKAKTPWMLLPRSETAIHPVPNTFPATKTLATYASPCEMDGNGTRPSVQDFVGKIRAEAPLVFSRFPIKPECEIVGVVVLFPVGLPYGN